MALSGCSLPRGAGFQGEVLAASSAGNREEGIAPVYDFAVFEVNRNTLPVLQSWPALHTQSYPWIRGGNQPASLIIAPGDTLQLAIWDAEENSLLSGTAQRVTPMDAVPVGASGRIFIPYIGELQVSGMSPETARARIEEELIRSIPSAQVQLVVEPGRANTANIVSGAGVTGPIPLPDRNYKILDLLAQAGGPNPTFVNPQVRLIRNDRLHGVAFDRLLREPSLNTAMRGGDTVFIEDDERQFLSLGATGSEAVHPFPSAEVTALEALSIIGGVSDATANPQGILVMREYPVSALRDDNSGPPKDRVVFTIDLTSADGLFSAGKFMLEDGDLIYGTESALGPALSVVGLFSTLSSLN
ncbi:polysaccharide biosynthesis/export family protein [Loktanella agnita]|uniref:polysaccharide biosynthesis/export family protein n=1 Tax=Loktanella agnita TaxID=287097 RepID=UPI00398960D6